MKGILLKSLVAIIVLSGSVVAQVTQMPPVFDEAYLQLYGALLMQSYPAARDFNGGGARARGMGNAFLGVSDDASAVSWNPAGLYRPNNQYEQPVVSLSYQSLSSDPHFTSKPYVDFESRQFDFHDVSNGVNFMSIVLPLRVKGHLVVGSLAYARLGDEVYNSGMGFDVMMPFDAADVADDIVRPFHYQIEVNYRSAVNALNIGFGTRIYNELSFGLAINAYGGRAARVTDERITWEELIIVEQGQQRGTGLYVNSVYDTTSFSGVYFTFGLKYASKDVSAGFIIKTPHILKETTDILLDTRGYANGAEVEGVGNTLHFDDNIIELDQPMVLGGGVGIQATDNLLLALDVELRQYSSGMVNRRDSLRLVPGGTDIEFFTEFDPYWSNTWAIRMGGEYVWETGGSLFPTIPIRAGFGYVQLPTANVDSYKDVDGNPVENPVANFLAGEELVPVTSKTSTTKWSLGAGVRWAQIDLDFAYEKSSGDIDQSVFRQKWSTDNSSFSVMFTGYF